MSVACIVLGLVRVELNWGSEVCDYKAEGTGV
jgi:hypothetical protein